MKHSEIIEEMILEAVTRNAEELRRLADDVEGLTALPAHKIPGRLAHALTWGMANLNQGRTATLLGDLMEALEAEEA